MRIGHHSGPSPTRLERKSIASRSSLFLPCFLMNSCICNPPESACYAHFFPRPFPIVLYRRLRAGQSLTSANWSGITLSCFPRLMRGAMCLIKPSLTLSCFPRVMRGGNVSHKAFLTSRPPNLVLFPLIFTFPKTQATYHLLLAPTRDSIVFRNALLATH